MQTRAAFELIACNPNVAAAIVVSLGCETVQGSSLAAAIAERGRRVELAGIQEQGGSRACVSHGVEVGERACWRRSRRVARRGRRSATS